MIDGRKRLEELLVAHRLITQEQLEQALAIQQTRHELLGDILVQLGFITEERLLQVLAMQKGVAAWQLQNEPPTYEAVSLLTGDICRSYQILPVAVKGDRLVLAMRDPDDVEAIEMVRSLTNLRVEPVLASETRLARTIEEVYHGAVPTNRSVDRLVNRAMGEISQDQGEEPQNATVTEAEMRPVVGLVNQIIAEAIRMGASDIHIEPRIDRVEIRYRIDGQLQRVREIPSALQRALIARIKIMAVLDIVEYRVPQDGRISVTVDGRPVDIRVSVLPNYHGQRVVLRILDKSIALRTLDEIGFSEHNIALFMEMITKPYGLILVTGPTGSGKTTTLYAALNYLKQVTNNIMTCEDPVEYDIDGINQSYVNEKVGLTFAKQLRAILRQDPDIILVGEIRDGETAETAIRAALTGHLVLSTLHCNDAPSAIPRLTDMGVEPFLLSTALIGVMAQRLIRVLCPYCAEEYIPSQEEQRLLSHRAGPDAVRIWRPVGCPNCNSIGYRGRTGIHEVMPIPAEMQKLIAECAPMETLRHAAALYGYRPLQEDVCDRVLMGQTSLEEARRVVFFEMRPPGLARRLMTQAVA